MPTYNYKCNTCDNKFEVFQNITDQTLQFCKNCEGELERIISGGTGLIFKGSGFYLTDYSRKNNNIKNKEKNQKKTIKQQIKKDNHE